MSGEFGFTQFPGSACVAVCLEGGPKVSDTSLLIYLSVHVRAVRRLLYRTIDLGKLAD